jgi:hypothetical protein
MSLEQAARLAGFFTAHAVWCLTDRSDEEGEEALVPMFAHETVAGEPQMMRMVDGEDDLGLRLLAKNRHPAAAFVYDGVLDGADGEQDALIAHFDSPANDGGAMVIALPYSPPEGARPLLLLEPVVLEAPEGMSDDDVDALTNAFIEGAEGHEEGSKAWEQHLSSGGVPGKA